MKQQSESLLPFKISRIHTEIGVFKVDGYRSSFRARKMTIILSTVFILSTDGWEELALTQTNNDFMKQLIPYLECHLKASF